MSFAQLFACCIDVRDQETFQMLDCVGFLQYIQKINLATAGTKGAVTQFVRISSDFE
jgi:hypothetical protein